MTAEGCRWIASGQGVLANSLRQSHQDTSHKQDYLIARISMYKVMPRWSCFFRDDQLSDLSSFRLIRQFKNRFGAVNELGVFAMTERGLREVSRIPLRRPCSSTVRRSPVPA